MNGLPCEFWLYFFINPTKEKKKYWSFSETWKDRGNDTVTWRVASKVYSRPQNSIHQADNNNNSDINHSLPPFTDIPHLETLGRRQGEQKAQKAVLKRPDLETSHADLQAATG
jgi:hypothetical protein